MKFCTIADGRIARIYCGDINRIEGAVALPKDFAGHVGQDVREFDDDWKLRPLQERVDDGLVEKEPWEKVDGEQLVPMTPLERLKAKVDEIPPGFKLGEAEDHPLIPMTPLERLKSGTDKPLPGYKVGYGEAEPMIPMTLAELYAEELLTLDECKERMADSVDVEWSRRLGAGFEYEGNWYPLDEGALGAWGRFMEKIHAGLPVSPYARTVDNRNVDLTVESFPTFYTVAADRSEAEQRGRSDTKDRLRACATYDSAMMVFEEYMGGTR